MAVRWGVQVVVWDLLRKVLHLLRFAGRDLVGHLGWV